MTDTIEINHLDLRYECLRLSDNRREGALLCSILEQGILDPLYVCGTKSSEYILLDGFKRYRCAVKMKMTQVPITHLDSDAVMGILKFLRLSLSRGIDILEQAGLVDELYQNRGLNTSEISRRLECSLSWVTARLGLFKEMSPFVKEKIFSGKFPVRNYMYTLRPYTRVDKTAGTKEIEAFVTRVSGKKYSTRDIELLAKAWFKGSKALKEQVKTGDLDWTLRQLKDKPPESQNKQDDMSEAQGKVISNLQIVTSVIFRLNNTLGSAPMENAGFTRKAKAASGGLINMLSDFENTLKEFYDRCAKTAGDTHLVSLRQG